MKRRLIGSSIGLSIAWYFCTAFVGMAAEPATSVTSQASSTTAKRPPNIVFLFCDDHAYQSIGAYGSKLVDTPNIDLLAKHGMRFDRCLGNQFDLWALPRDNSIGQVLAQEWILDKQ